MDDMRDRYRVPSGERASRPVHESLKHAYQPPPKISAPVNSETLIEPAPAAQAAPRKPRRRAWRKSVLLVLILSALAGAGVYAYPKYISPNPFPANIQTNAGLTLFYPGKLPTGYKVDKTNMTFANGVVIYTASSQDKRLVFTLQKTPPSFNFQSFYKQQLSDTQFYSTPFGSATIGKSGGHFLGSLTYGNTWLLLSPSSNIINKDDFSLVLQNLKKY